MLPCKLLKLGFLHALRVGALSRETALLKRKYERLGGNFSALTKDGGLVWAVPTMQRANNAQYLSATVESILEHNVPSADITVMKTGRNPHPEFELLRAIWEVNALENTLPPLVDEPEWKLPSKIAEVDPTAVFYEAEGWHKKEWRMNEAR
eukprot:SAG22_NODE_843_length_6889_cov_61.521649_4_plen_151_part_00